MDPYDGSVLGKGQGWEPIRSAMGQTRRVAERMNLAAMAPRNELASTGYCLANPGRGYLVYQPTSGHEFTLRLRSGKYHLVWINPSQGADVGDDLIEAVEGVRRFKAPFDGAAVLYLKETGH
jgi:hypothetical protein